VVQTRTARTLLLIVLAAAAFGAAMSVVKGNDAGIRDDIGNLSAPWLLLPFFAGAAVERRDLAAAAGLAATVVALVAFYVANAFVLELGPHSLATDLRLTLGATGYWIPRGIVSGPVFGALGGLWRRRGYPALLGVAVLLLLDAEPLFWIAAHRMGGIASFAFQPSLAASAAEAALGVAAAAFTAWFLRRTHRRAMPAATE